MVEQLRPTGGDPVDVVLAGLAETAIRSRTADPADRVRVLDIGGGSGTRAVPLAMLGCAVTVVDSSANALAILHRRAEDAGVGDRVTGVQADADRLDTVALVGPADLVVCHHLLEEVDDPVVVLRAAARALRVGGSLSVLVSGRLGAVLAQTLVGRFEQARELLTGPDGRFGAADPLRRRFDDRQIREAVRAAGLVVDAVTGVGVLSGLVSGAALQAAPGGEGELAAVESAAAVHPDLVRIAADLHVVAHRPDGAATG